MILSTCLTISACGFQLRGNGGHGAINMGGTKIVLNTPSRSLDVDFRKSLKRQLTMLDAELIIADQQASIQSSEANILLSVISLDFSTQGVSRDETGRANEHEVTASLDFLLQSPEANQQSSLENHQDDYQSIKVTANYYQDFRNPIGELAQKKQTRKQLLKQLSQRLIAQMQHKMSN